nr:carboxypeptidase-like regulatory domain-containing protein [Candidatus Cloacimonadota bacterium]
PVANWFMQDEPEFYEAGPFSALLITLSNGVTSYSTASDIRGNFSFKRLQPGQWTLKIDKNSLPKNYETEWEELNIVLSAAQDIEIIIKVSEKLKRVIIRQID